jgi:biotin carboxyl carrier protein
LTFEVEVNGRLRTVAVGRAGPAPDRFRVTVDGVTRLVLAQRAGEYGVSMLFPDSSDASRTVHIAPLSERGDLLAHAGGRTARVVVNGRRRRHGAGDAVAAHGEQTVAAPMPGRVVRVLVEAGEDVEARQPLVVVEAMKMENELRSPKAGRVKTVGVTAGTSVEAGRVLVVVE